MGKYKIEFSSKAAKDYKKLQSGYKELVDFALFKLSNGLSLDMKPIIGEKMFSESE
ncbi:MAG: type II toxin-antitoxin system RelE family toxin [Athalassotoga sp.]